MVFSLPSIKDSQRLLCCSYKNIFTATIAMTSRTTSIVAMRVHLLMSYSEKNLLEWIVSGPTAALKAECVFAGRV